MIVEFGSELINPEVITPTPSNNSDAPGPVIKVPGMPNEFEIVCVPPPSVISALTRRKQPVVPKIGSIDTGSGEPRYVVSLKPTICKPSAEAG